jgi:hypothetical protein
MTGKGLERLQRVADHCQRHGQKSIKYSHIVENTYTDKTSLRVCSSEKWLSVVFGP